MQPLNGVTVPKNHWNSTYMRRKRMYEQPAHNSIEISSRFHVRNPIVGGSDEVLALGMVFW